jgi:dienelactone hydrolase
LCTSTRLVSLSIIFLLFSPVSQATWDNHCSKHPAPKTSFITYQSPDITQPPSSLTIQGKLKLPVRFSWKKRCFSPRKNLPAVVILHGSGGIDFRGDFYARALNAAGIATLEIDMWEARGVTAPPENQLPIVTYPDAFAALAFLSTHENINPDRIGVLGFSWGGVVTMASAEELYANQFGGVGGLRFAAHAAHYPVCYGYNTILPNIPPPPLNGLQWLDLTGAPVLIQIGTEDDYDNGAENCLELIDDLLDPEDQNIVEVAVYEDAYHAWDRLQVLITVNDLFANEGSYFTTGVVPEVVIIPDVDKAYKSRKKVVRFFRRNL